MLSRTHRQRGHVTRAVRLPGRGVRWSRILQVAPNNAVVVVVVSRWGGGLLTAANDCIRALTTVVFPPPGTPAIPTTSGRSFNGVAATNSSTLALSSATLNRSARAIASTATGTVLHKTRRAPVTCSQQACQQAPAAACGRGGRTDLTPPILASIAARRLLMSRSWPASGAAELAQFEPSASATPEATPTPAQASRLHARRCMMLNIIGGQRSRGRSQRQI